MSNFNYDADAFAQASAEAKKINKLVDDLKKKFIKSGVGEYVGEFYTVTYKQSEAPLTFDKDVAAELLKEFGLTPDQIARVWECKSASTPRNLVSYEATALSTANAHAA